MGVSTGQVFQPKIMSVVEPQKRESAWEQVLPTILTSLAQTAVKGYIENKVGENKIEQEKLAKGYTKNPDGTWNEPEFKVKQVAPGMYSYSYGGQAGLHNAPKGEQINSLDAFETHIANLRSENKTPKEELDRLDAIARDYRERRRESPLNVTQAEIPGVGNAMVGVTRDTQGNYVYKTIQPAGSPASGGGASPRLTTPPPGGWGESKTKATPTTEPAQTEPTLPTAPMSPVPTETARTAPIAPISPSQQVVDQASDKTKQQQSVSTNVVGQTTPQILMAPNKEHKQASADKAQDIMAKQLRGEVVSQDEQSWLQSHLNYTQQIAGLKMAPFGHLEWQDVDPELREISYLDYFVTGDKPRFSNRDALNTQLWNADMLSYRKANDISPTEIQAIRQQYKAFGGSLTLQQKNLGMMDSFVTNIKEQKKQLDAILTSDLVSRSGLRLIDMPYREARKALEGSGMERILDGYFTEMAREMNRLSGGSPASIAEMTESSRKTWEKILDPSAPYKIRELTGTDATLGDITTIGDQVVKWADTRKASLEKSIADTMRAMEKGYLSTGTTQQSKVGAIATGVPGALGGTQAPPEVPTPSPAPDGAATKPMSIYDFYQIWTETNPQKAATKEGQSEVWGMWLRYRDKYGIK